MSLFARGWPMPIGSAHVGATDFLLVMRGDMPWPQGNTLLPNPAPRGTPGHPDHQDLVPTAWGSTCGRNHPPLSRAHRGPLWSPKKSRRVARQLPPCPTWPRAPGNRWDSGDVLGRHPAAGGRSGSDPGSAPTEGGLSIMSPTPGRCSTTPMSRFQFLMLRAVEGGASLSEASDEALGWGVRHPDNDLFEHRPYAAWEAGRHDADHEDHADHENDGGSGAPSRKPSTPPGPDVWTEPSGEGFAPGVEGVLPASVGGPPAADDCPGNPAVGGCRRAAAHRAGDDVAVLNPHWPAKWSPRCGEMHDRRTRNQSKVVDLRAPVDAEEPLMARAEEPLISAAPQSG